jgi:3-methylcrotonyl-CoA carboxylase alpha subunit
MFAKILIANRGEIACRIIDTARRLGVATVAVYSEADRGSRHVAMADEARAIGGAAAADSYLRGERLLQAARETGAEAIHPGYGFLSENPEFAEAVTAAGLKFIGPSAAAIRAMGLKDAAKARMAAAGVPVVPGWQGAAQDLASLQDAADHLGYPLLIKAVAGGGGKGMRLVSAPQEFAAALASAQGEAQAAFGNPAVLLETYVQAPRHIEVQIFGDGQRAVHLFERDCSLQRRHQKVIEEAPAPGMTPEMRVAMGQAAVRAAEAIGYAGAGTVEFIVDARDGLRPDRFWFMEMNTRLQVEHPVTEAVTGIDLVEWQLRVAAGAPLPLAQSQITLTGHAFEARLYAEDVAAGFLPATGRLAHLAFPGFARAETGVRPGDSISPWYDPMIAKIITKGADRAGALRQMQAALAATEVAGTVTNLDFLQRLVALPEVVSGALDTGLIARAQAAGQVLPAPPTARQMALALLTAAEEGAAVGVSAGVSAGVAEGVSAGAALRGFSLWAPLPRMIRFEEGLGQVLWRGPDRAEVRWEEERLACERLDGVWWIDGQRMEAQVLRQGRQIWIFGPSPQAFTLADPLAIRAAGPGGGDSLAPMPGLVRAVHVVPGQQVAAGTPLALLEAMKMEHVLAAARAGVVAEVFVAPGDQVEAGALMVRLSETVPDAAPEPVPAQRAGSAPAP